MSKGVPIRVSRELRDALGNMKSHSSESYDAVLRRKLFLKRQRKQRLKARLLPNFKPVKATRDVLNSDKKVTRGFLQAP